MRVALDTKVLAYAEGTDGMVMRDRALELIQQLPHGGTVLLVQTLDELFNVLVRKRSGRHHTRGKHLLLHARIGLVF